MVYRRGGKWWFKFRFAGRQFREPAKSASKDLARKAERKRRLELEEGYHGLKKRQAPQTLKAASEAWLELKQPTVTPKTHRIEKTNLGHVLPVLGQKLLSDIDPDDISHYQQHRLRDKAAPKTINLEVGTIRAILRRHRLWANLQPDVRMLATREDAGKALPTDDEKRLLDGCAESRSRSLLPAVLLALNTGMRYSELRLLRWEQIDFERRTVRVGQSKTEAGTGRTIPLNDKATKALKFWATSSLHGSPSTSPFRPNAMVPEAMTSSQPSGTLTRNRPSVHGKRRGSRSSARQVSRSGSTTFDTRASRACSKAACRFRLWRRFSAGARQQRHGWRSGTGTSDTSRCGRR
jgi:integrase